MHEMNPDTIPDEPDLSVPTHILPQLFELLAGDGLPNVDAQHEMEGAPAGLLVVSSDTPVPALRGGRSGSTDG